MISVVLPISAETRSEGAALAGRLIHAGAQVVLTGAAAPHVDGALTVPGPLAAAFAAVRGEITVVQSADPLWGPEGLTGLSRPILDDVADVVVAARDRRSAAERGLGALARRVTQLEVSDPLSTRRAFRTELLRGTPLTPEADDVELLVKTAAQLYRFAEVPAHAPAASRRAPEVLALGRALVKYAASFDEADTAHEGYVTLERLASGAPNYNAWLGARFRAHAGARVLEIGAGIGTITAQLAEGRERVVALEVDAVYVQRLKNRFRGMPQVTPYLSDVALADFESLKKEGFDSIVLSNVLEHIPDDGGAVRRFAQILPPNGKVLILVPALPAIFGSMDEAVGHHRRYTPATLRGVLEDNGFEVELLEWMNLVGIPGWFVNGRLFKRRTLPPLQLRLYDQLAPWLARAEARLRLPVGMSLFCVAQRR